MLLAEHQPRAPGEEKREQSRDSLSAVTPKGRSVAPRPENTAPPPLQRGGGWGAAAQSRLRSVSPGEGSGTERPEPAQVHGSALPSPSGPFSSVPPGDGYK